MLILNLFIKYL